MFDVLFKLKWFLKENKWRYVFSFLCIGISNVTAVIIPYLVGRFIDSIVTGEMNPAVLTTYTIQFAALIILTYFLDFYWGIGFFGGGFKLQKDLRQSLMRHFLLMRAPYFEKFRTGDLMARGTQDIRSISETMGYGMMILMNASGFAVTLILMMGLTVSWSLTLATILPMLPMAYVFKKKGSEMDQQFEISQKAFSTVNDDVLEMIDGIRVIRAYVKENDFINKFRSQTEDLLKKNNKVNDIAAVFSPVVKIFEGIAIIISLSYGAYLVASNLLSVGDIVAFQMYLGMMVWPIIAASELILIMRQGNASMRRLEQVTKSTDGLELNGEINAENVDDLSFKHFNFTYGSSERINLDDIDLSLSKGQTLGIVGKTGSGKTTLIRQLLNQFPAGEGAFDMGEHAYSAYNDPSLRRLIGYVPQDHILFSRTVKENIAFGKKDATDEEILKSIHLASFDKDLKNMEKGIETLIGEKGASISGGQKQRISIARALIKNPDILILDDSLSAVDAKTEQEITANIQSVRQGKTTIISTHRLSAVKQADTIVVMDDGKIVEEGTHEQLLENQGWYFEQYLRQELQSSAEGGIH